MEQADKQIRIFLNGDIVTMDPDRPTAAALAVEGDRILALGTPDELESLRAKAAEIIDLGGRTLLPGLIEPHTHPITSALLYEWADVSAFTHNSRAEVLASLSRAISQAEKGQWVTAFGYDPILIRDLAALTADELDILAPDNPVFVMIQSMHTAFVNRQALRRANIDEAAPKPVNGHFVKDRNGRLTGMVVEQGGMLPFLACMLLEGAWDGEKLMSRQLHRFARAGYTTLGAMGEFPLFPNSASTLQRLAESGPTPLRVVFLDKAADLESGSLEKTGPDSERFHRRGVKFWYDGSPYSGNMFLDQPFVNSDLMQVGLGLPRDSPGYAMLPRETLQALVEKYHDQGRQVVIHGQGDRAIREIVEVYARALARTPRSDHRHRIEHGALFPLDQLAPAARLGVCPSWHINHIYYYGEALRDDIIGPERAGRLMPFKDALRQGLRCSLHNDSPMYPPEPFKLVRTAVTRGTRRGAVIGADQAVSVAEALRAVTIDAAWQLFLDKEVGSLTPGKKADLAVLSANPLKIDPLGLDGVRVLATYSGGRKVFGSEDAPA
ncbi:MAG: amidohydrolase [Pseudomonadota bacterium]